MKNLSSGNKGTGNRAVVSFLVFLVMALICFGIFGFIFSTAKSGGAPVDESVVSVSKIFVFSGLFFLVMAFAYALPNVVKSKRNKDGVQADSTDIFNEVNMRKALERYMPAGETMLAGVHVVTKESSVSCAFEGCVITEDKLVPATNDEIATVSKTKMRTYDMYLAITQHFLVVADCEPNRYFYEFNKAPVTNKADIYKVTEDIYLRDIGKCFPLENIASCKIKNGFAGSVNCEIKLRNGSYFKLMIPATGGMSGGMPNHSKYKDEIIACLSQRV